MDENLSNVHFFGGAKLGSVLLIVGTHFAVGGRRGVGGKIADQFLPPHVVTFFDDGGAGIIAHGGGDFFRGDLHAVSGGVFRQDDLLHILIQHGTGHFGPHLRQIGSGVAFEVSLEVGERDHPIAHSGHHIGRNCRLAVTRGHEQADEEQQDAAHASAKV